MDIKNKVRLSHAKKILEESKLTYNLNYIAEKLALILDITSTLFLKNTKNVHQENT